MLDFSEAPYILVNKNSLANYTVILSVDNICKEQDG